MINDFNIKKPTPSELLEIDNLRAAMRERFRNVPDEGMEIEYLDKKFRVFKNVFWPFEDSKALVKHFTIHPGESVLDVGTGSGVIAIFAAYKGAKRVLALDVNPDAVHTAMENVKLHNFEDVIEVRLSNMLDGVVANEKFDVIVSNPPFSDKKSQDFVESTMYDADFNLHKAIFDGAQKHLKKGGRIYIAQSNFGQIERMLEMATESGFSIKKIGENAIPNDFRIFYAFELSRL